MHNGQKGRVREGRPDGSVAASGHPAPPRGPHLSQILSIVCPFLPAACAPSPTPPSHFRPVEAAAGRRVGVRPAPTSHPSPAPNIHAPQPPLRRHLFSALLDHYPLGRVYMTGSGLVQGLGLAGDLGGLSHQGACGGIPVMGGAGRGAEFHGHFEATMAGSGRQNSSEEFQQDTKKIYKLCSQTSTLRSLLAAPLVFCTPTSRLQQR